MNEELDRIRQKYKTLGISALNDREILVLLMSYSVSADKACTAADKLLEMFGSLCAVLERSPQLLIDTKIVDQKTAVLLTIQPALVRLCSREKTEAVWLTDENREDILRALFIGQTTEHFYMISLTETDKIIATDCLSEGTNSRATVYTRQALSIALNNGAKKVILTHNHPNGSPMPSDDDTRLTLNLHDALEVIGVELVDHVVISGEASVSMSKDMHIFEKRIPLRIRSKFTTAYRPT